MKHTISTIKFHLLGLAFLVMPLFGLAQEAQNAKCIGRTVLNSTGGTTATNGIRIITTGAGNMQIVRNGTAQIFQPSQLLDTGTSKPYLIPGTTSSILLFIGNTFFRSRDVATAVAGFTDRGVMSIVSNTCQADVGPLQGTQQNIVRLSAVKNGLTYYLNIKYKYVFPQDRVTITYTVEVPVGNTETVKLSHGWDTYLDGDDRGPGFVKGTAPFLQVGVQKTGAFEAFNYLSGVPWSGYYSALYSSLIGDLATDATFNNVVNTNSIDNGIGISMNFGSTAGTFSSESAVSFSCAAPNTAPSLTGTTLTNKCLGNSVNLNSLFPGTLPTGMQLLWFKSNNQPYDSPTEAEAGSYFAAFYDPIGGCYGPTSQAVTVTINPCELELANTCPVSGVDLTAHAPTTSPTGTVVSYHSASPPSTTNQITAAQAKDVTSSGTYFISYFDTESGCFAPPSWPIKVTITECCPVANLKPDLTK